MLSVVTTDPAAGELCLDLDAIVREGARRMLAAALDAEVDDYLAAYQAERDEHGRRLVVRNGHARERQVVTAAGAVRVRAPRVDDRRVDPVTGGRGFGWWSCRPGVGGAQGRRGAAVAVPAWVVHRRLRARPGSVLRLGGRVVGGGDYPPGRRLAGRVRELLPPRPVRGRPCGPLGRWRAPPGAPGAGPPVLFGDRGRARRRDQGTGGRGRRRARVHRVVGGAAARPAPPRHAGTSRRRW